MSLIAVTCRNGLELTKKCLPTVLGQRSCANILVADNASDDGTSRWIAGQPVHLLSLAKPISVAALWNRIVRMHSTQFFLIVNNDTELLPETCITLLDYMRGNEKVGIATCISRRADESLDYTVLTESDHPDFSCFMLRRKCWEDLGGFDEGYEGAYCEDNDFHVRMWRNGWRAVGLSLPFIHHGCGTLNHADPEEKERIMKQADKNRARFYQKYGVRIGTPEYDSLFTPETFGSEKRR